MIVKRKQSRKSKALTTEEEEQGVEKEDPSLFREIPFDYVIIHQSLYHPSVFRKYPYCEWNHTKGTCFSSSTTRSTLQLSTAVSITTSTRCIPTRKRTITSPATAPSMTLTSKRCRRPTVRDSTAFCSWRSSTASCTTRWRRRREAWAERTSRS